MKGTREEVNGKEFGLEEKMERGREEEKSRKKRRLN